MAKKNKDDFDESLDGGGFSTDFGLSADNVFTDTDFSSIMGGSSGDTLNAKKEKGFIRTLISSAKSFSGLIIGSLVPDGVDFVNSAKDLTDAFGVKIQKGLDSPQVRTLTKKLVDIKEKGIKNIGSEFIKGSKKTIENLYGEIKKGNIFFEKQMDLNSFLGSVDEVGESNYGSQVESKDPAELALEKAKSKINSIQMNKSSDFQKKITKATIESGQKNTQYLGNILSSRNHSDEVKYQRDRIERLKTETNTNMLRMNMADTLKKILKFHLEIERSHIETDIDYKLRSLASARETQGILKQLNENIIKIELRKNYKQQVKEAGYAMEKRKASNLFGSSSLDSGTYADALTEQAKGILGSTTWAQMFGMGKSMYDMQKGMGGFNVPQMLLGSLPNIMMGGKTRYRLSKFNDLFQGAWRGVNTKMLDMRFSKNPLMQMMGNMMGVHDYNSTSSSFGVGLDNEAKFDGRVYTSIIKVIPDLLSRILNELGGPKLSFDQTSQTFVTEKEEKEYYTYKKSMALKSNDRSNAVDLLIEDKTQRSNEKDGKEMSKDEITTMKKDFLKIKENFVVFQLNVSPEKALEGSELFDSTYYMAVSTDIENPENVRKFFEHFQSLGAEQKRMYIAALGNIAKQYRNVEKTWIDKQFDSSSTVARDMMTKEARKKRRFQMEAMEFQEKQNLKANKGKSMAANNTQRMLRQMKMGAIMDEMNEFKGVEAVDSIQRGVSLGSSESNADGGRKSSGQILNDIYETLVTGIAVYPSTLNKSVRNMLNTRMSAIKHAISIQGEEEKKRMDSLANAPHDISDMALQTEASQAAFYSSMFSLADKGFAPAKAFDTAVNTGINVGGRLFNKLYGVKSVNFEQELASAIDMQMLTARKAKGDSLTAEEEDEITKTITDQVKKAYKNEEWIQEKIDKVVKFSKENSVSRIIADKMPEKIKSLFESGQMKNENFEEDYKKSYDFIKNRDKKEAKLEGEEFFTKRGVAKSTVKMKQIDESDGLIDKIFRKKDDDNLKPKIINNYTSDSTKYVKKIDTNVEAIRTILEKGGFSSGNNASAAGVNLSKDDLKKLNKKAGLNNNPFFNLAKWSLLAPATIAGLGAKGLLGIGKLGASAAGLGIKAIKPGAKLAGKTIKGVATLGSKAALGTAKLGGKVIKGGTKAGVNVAKLGVKSIKPGATLAGKTIKKTAEVGGKAILGTAKIGTKAALGAAKVGGKVVGTGFTVAGAAAGGAIKGGAEALGKKKKIIDPKNLNEEIRVQKVQTVAKNIIKGENVSVDTIVKDLNSDEREALHDTIQIQEDVERYKKKKNNKKKSTNQQNQSNVNNNKTDNNMDGEDNTDGDGKKKGGRSKVLLGLGVAGLAAGATAGTLFGANELKQLNKNMKKSKGNMIQNMLFSTSQGQKYDEETGELITDPGEIMSRNQDIYDKARTARFLGRTTKRSFNLVKNNLNPVGKRSILGRMFKGKPPIPKPDKATVKATQKAAKKAAKEATKQVGKQAGKNTGKLAKVADGMKDLIAKLAKFFAKAKDFFLKVLKKAGMSDKVIKFLNNGLTFVIKTVKRVITKSGPSIIGKVFKKIAAISAKIFSGVGAIVMGAVEFTSGMTNAKNYFEVPRGTEIPTKIRILAGAINVLTNYFTFGFVPPGSIAKFLLNNAKGGYLKDFSDDINFMKNKTKIRAKHLQVNVDKLINWEARTWGSSLWNNLTFNKSGNYGTLLGFGKKKDEKTKKTYKEWNKELYKPLNRIWDDLSKDDEYKYVIDEETGEKTKLNLFSAFPGGGEEGSARQEAFFQAADQEMGDYVKENSLENFIIDRIGEEAKESISPTMEDEEEIQNEIENDEQDITKENTPTITANEIKKENQSPKLDSVKPPIPTMNNKDVTREPDVDNFKLSNAVREVNKQNSDTSNKLAKKIRYKRGPDGKMIREIVEVPRETVTYNNNENSMKNVEELNKAGVQIQSESNVKLSMINDSINKLADATQASLEAQQSADIRNSVNR